MKMISDEVDSLTVNIRVTRDLVLPAASLSRTVLINNFLYTATSYQDDVHLVVRTY